MPTTLIGSGADDLWVAGENGAMGAISHFDGANWVLQLAPATRTIFGMHQVATNEVYAVGRLPGPSYGGALLRYDGVSWSLVSGPSVGTGSYKAVWANTTGIYLLGWVNQLSSKVWMWDGSTWSDMALPDLPVLPGATNAPWVQPGGIWADPSGDLWVAGTVLDNGKKPVSGIVFRHQSTGWSWSYLSTSLVSVSGNGPCDVTVSGFDGPAANRQAVAFRFDGSVWSGAVYPPAQIGEATIVSAENQAAFVGYDDQIGTYIGLDDGSGAFSLEPLPSSLWVARSVAIVNGTPFVVGDGNGLGQIARAY